MSQTAAAKKSTMPKWMIIAGILTVVAGWGTRNYAASMMREALRMAPICNSDLPPIPDYEPDCTPTVESAMSLGYVGLGVIIFGAALFLAGLVVMAIRR